MERFNYYLRLFEIWLLFPAVWFLLYTSDKKETSKKSDTVFYTSVKAPKGSEVDLYKGNTFMVGLKPTGNCFNPLQYQGKIKFSDSLNIRVSGVSDQDTVSFLAINLYKKKTPLTFGEEQFKYVEADSAKVTDTTSHLLRYVAEKNIRSFIIYLPTARIWSRPDISNFIGWTVFSVFLLMLILLFFIKPSVKFMLIATLLSCGFLCFYWWIGKDASSQLSVKNNTPLKTLSIYRDSMPEFFPDMCNNYTGNDTTFRIQIDLSLYPYYRISLNKGIASLENFSFRCGFGLLSKTWNLNSLNPSEMFTNDMDYNIRTSTWKVAGNDPYICLTTSPFITSIDKISFLRKSLFLFISAFIFIISLLSQPLLSNLTIPKTILAITFFSILLNSIFLYFFNSDKLILDAEKRLANIQPVYDSNSFPEYTRKLSLYLQDQLPGRNNLIISNNFIKYEAFGRIPGNSQVYFGKDGWMFYMGDNSREIYENRHPLKPKELLQIKNLLVGRRDWLKERHIHYYIFFPRLPFFIYNEKTGPDLMVYNLKPKLVQLLEYLKQNTDLDIIDVETPIQDAKAKYKKSIYYSNDSHWTQFGAYFAYETIINYIHKDFPNMPSPIPFNKIKWGEGDDDNGDLAKLICLNTVIKRHIYVPVNKRIGDFHPIKAPDYPEFLSIYPMLFYQSKDTLAPKLIMFRDSYSNALIPYFATNFSRQGYLWTPVFYPTIIEKEKPDIVITELAERNIYELLKDTPPRDSVPPITVKANGKE